MPIDLTLINNKQRILITGNHGLEKISKIIRAVLDHLKKPYGYMDSSESIALENPIIFYKGGSELENGEALFHQFQPHIALIYKISEKLPEGYESFEQYLGEYEKLADNLPKSGSIVYSESDNVTMMIGKKERVDVRAIEFDKLVGQKTKSGYILKFENDAFEVVTDNENFLSHAAASLAFLKRIGITEAQFHAALKAN
ncbi:MAG: UDP-N-acetylmuramate: L-alanyl-gamma-D-glutamyl-meso-diaminopimelate ligase [Cyclobacteriaceae bacterium]|jgi:UDP-N-acetylmuramate: L-alanyl-gamma-D-glutamyl-meso-diaminopimelate ligase